MADTTASGRPSLASALRSRLFPPRRPEPSYPARPEVNDRGESSVPGIFVAGELAGMPLIKLGLEEGHAVAERIAGELRGEPTPAGGGGEEPADLVVVGAGCAGLGAAVAAKDAGISCVVLEAARAFNTVVGMTRGKRLFAEPAGAPRQSRVWFEECTREELLERWRRFVADEGLDIREGVRVTGVRGRRGDFVVETTAGPIRARRVLLAVGKAGNPRKLGVPGEREHIAKVHHRLGDPADYPDADVLIVGAGDVAAEAAITLAERTRSRITLSAIDRALTYPKRRNVEALERLAAAGRVRLLLASSVKRIDADSVTVRRADGQEERIPNDVVFEMIGADPPLPFLKKVGVRLEGAWRPARWAALAAVFIAVYSLYALKSYGKGAAGWPFDALVPAGSYDAALREIFRPAFAPFAWLFDDAALADMLRDRGFQQGYLYSLVYTVIMMVFGYLALVRWRRKARDPRYQTYRYLSLIAFQVIFFLGVNVVGVKALSLKYAWRAWGLYQPFPLFFNTFFWWYPGDPATIKWFFIGAGLLGSLVAIPWLARNHGKRFCTWVCGCGGLAETLGDRWRHRSPKGPRSRAWEFQGAVVLAASVIVLLVVVGLYHTDGNNPWWRAYSYLVDFWLVAVIPIALYPFFGGKIWCRYWCPLAAYNQLLSRWYGRLKIVSNDRCITCTECSRYCQVGVDVMAFAKNQQPFDNSNSACIHCGICIDVCPMGVLSFETSAPRAVELIRAGKRRGEAPGQVAAPSPAAAAAAVSCGAAAGAPCGCRSAAPG